MSKPDKPVEIKPAVSPPHACLHTEAMDAMRVNGSGSFPRRYPESEVGDDVAYETRRIYESPNPGMVEWYATDSLNDQVLHSYARGRRHELDLRSGKVCLSDLTKPEITNLERYRALHDALVFKANDFATKSHGKISAVSLLVDWEYNGGFLRRPQPPAHHGLQKFFDLFHW